MTTVSPSEEMVEQSDRDAAAALFRLAYPHSSLTAMQISQGQIDDFSFVQAFARHRVAAASPIGELERALRDLLELVEAHGLEQAGDLPAHEFEAIVDGAVCDARRALAKVKQ